MVGALTPGGGRLADNVVHFTRLLRKAGLKVGPGQALGALQALAAVGIGEKRDFYWVMHATLVTAREQRPVFDAAFELFWRRRGLIEKMMASLLPETLAPPEMKKVKPASRRIADALETRSKPREVVTEETEVDARFTFSDRELLQAKDFDQMSAAEIETARWLVRDLVLPVDLIKTRRLARSKRKSRIDPMATIRASIRAGGDVIRLKYREPRLRHPPVIAMIDISGSMSGYSEILLHFMHALTAARPDVHTFLFGTRLTNVTRQLRAKDSDEALDAVSAQVRDWSGGTRISDCLHTFNRVWSRRVLGQGAIVLLISDGLERGDIDRLSREAERLDKSCRRLIWLNPLLRFDRFEALASGVRAIMAHVDEFRPVHNLDSITDLAKSLDGGHVVVKHPMDWIREAG
jgi:uncharacterized protein